MKRIIYLTLFFVVLASGSLIAQTINPPTDLEAESQDSSYIIINWQDNSSKEEGFYVERTLVNDSAYWEVIYVVSQNVRQYFDYWVTRGRQYYYRVFAYSGPIRSDYSNIDSAILQGDPSVIPSIPTNLIVINTTPTSITIQWDDNSTNENGFIIARKGENDLFFHYIDSVGPDILTYQEVGLTTDNFYTYKVCAFNDFGISEYSNTVSARTEYSSIVVNINEIPSGYFLGNNYPNPFNPTTTIKFGIPFYSFVRLKIYNSLGMEVESLLDQNLPVGTYQLKWNAQNFTSGIYFYKLEAVTSGLSNGQTTSQEQSFNEIKKMILIK